jgi:hypothetical protein
MSDIITSNLINYNLKWNSSLKLRREHVEIKQEQAYLY